MPTLFSYVEMPHADRWCHRPMSSRVRSTTRVLGLTLTIVLVFLMWPVTLGGQTAYVTTYGISMEPGISAGDLVVTRPDPPYQVGDVIAFWSPSLNRTVLHRVGSRDADAGVYTTKGDNNDWVDPEEVVASNVLGKQWLHVPGGGQWLSLLASPVVLAGMAAGLVWLAVPGAQTVSRGPRARRRANGRLIH